jgi:hypothetical protein
LAEDFFFAAAFFADVFLAADFFAGAVFFVFVSVASFVFSAKRGPSGRVVSRKLMQPPAL